MPEPKIEPADETHGSKLRALDEELSRLPQKYRTAVVQCELEGRSLREVAQQLGVPEGTVASRLARGRAMLAQRLTRRGLGVSATSVAALWSEQAASGTVPTALLNQTLEAIRLLAAGQTVTAGLLSTKVSTLTDGVLRAMAWAKWKAASVVLLLTGLAMGGGMVTYNVVANQPPPQLPPEPPGLSRTDSARQADQPVIVVTASYPGANARVVADTVAAPIEHQVNGVEGLVRIESTSDNEGQYTARFYFKPNTDIESVMKLVQSRVVLAEPIVADSVRQNKVVVKVGKAEASRNKVTIAIIDRENLGWEEAKKVANAVVKRLDVENFLAKPQAIPGDEKQLYVDIDRAKCSALGVKLDELFKVLESAIKEFHGPAANYRVDASPVLRRADVATEGKSLAAIKRVIVSDKVTLGDVAEFKEVYGPAAVYRVDLFSVIRITGTPPDRWSVAATAARCVEVAETELKRLETPGFGGFAVEDLSGK